MDSILTELIGMIQPQIDSMRNEVAKQNEIIEACAADMAILTDPYNGLTDQARMNAIMVGYFSLLNGLRAVIEETAIKSLDQAIKQLGEIHNQAAMILVMRTTQARIEALTAGNEPEEDEEITLQRKEDKSEKRRLIEDFTLLQTSMAQPPPEEIRNRCSCSVGEKHTDECPCFQYYEEIQEQMNDIGLMLQDYKGVK